MQIMKSLNQLPEIMAAFSKIAERRNISYNNGTVGGTYLCHFWKTEEMRNEELEKLESEKMMLKMQGKDYSHVLDKISNLEPTKVLLVFKLIDPIINLTGTKVVEFNGVKNSPKIEKCEYIYIPQDLLTIEKENYSPEFSTTKRNPVVDSYGNSASIIKLQLNSCMIDVKEGYRDRNDIRRWFIEPRAYVTDMSFRSMQLLAPVVNKANNQKHRMYSMFTDTELSNMNL